MTTTAVVAGWDVPQLRGAVVTLGVLTDRLVPWRSRLDELGRQLGAAGSWSGPAGTAAAAALVELSTITSGVGGALAASLADLTGLSAAADEAQELAAEALAVAAAGGFALDGAGRAVGVPAPPHPAMAPDQLADVEAARSAAVLAEARAEGARVAAARAGACARAAEEPLLRLGAVDVPVPDRFADLVDRLPPAPAPQVPATAGPRGAAAWWAGLTAAGQLQAIDGQPRAVGALDGLPAWARDRANRANLAAALRHLPPGSVGHDTAGVVQRTLTELVAAGSVAQLLQFDPATGLVALSVGDLDTAAAVGVLVPGVETTVVDDLAGLVGDARDVAAAAAVAAPGLAVATVAWLGYRTPRWFTSVSEHASQRGGRDLDRALDGLAASRAARAAGPAPRTTVLAHSYGTVVTGEAARAPGLLATDAVVLLGSPGTGTGTAEGLEAAEVYGAWSAADPIAWSGWYGAGPFDTRFGDVPLPTEPTQWHTQYYDRDRPTLAAVGAVVAGPWAPR
ncbi:alpha/beta hydrolase [Modestobacter sp. VKM Ac-2984]|uniref:alpha/beta hydrolase n=1 Tax=Modestobacter sp. VKM Ac-2984 TaxID=3004138 RepID=UPI0022AA28F5|nr:alpha/beta hydrolase [Modestobacter sp. VKM Ac-2984]MCZ2817571.1 alpha/beta hydrolase [Modestobacter sp. VKM Ac-2984]